MWQVFKIYALGLFVLAASLSPEISQAQTTRIAFGSCVKSGESSIWGSIGAKKPDAVVLLGDNIYQSEKQFGDKKAILDLYQQVYSYPLARTLLASTRILTIWDDHDFGPNDSDSTYLGARASLEVYRQFWNPPAPPAELPDSIAFQKTLANISIYGIDNRSYRINAGKGGATYFGAAQMSWLIRALQADPADVILLASGTALLGDSGHPDFLSAFPEEYGKLKTVIGLIKKPVVVISGDRHYGEIMEYRIGGRKVIEAISSPMTAEVKPANQVTRNSGSMGTFHGHNFGLLNITSTSENTKIQVSIFDKQGEEVLATEQDYPKNS